MATNPSPKRERRDFKIDGGLIVSGTVNTAGAVNLAAGGTVSGAVSMIGGTLTGGRYTAGTVNAPTVIGAASMIGGTLTGGQYTAGTVNAATFTGAQTQSGTVTGGTYAGTPTFSVAAALPYGTAQPTLATNGEVHFDRVGGTPRMYVRQAGTTYWVDLTSGTV